MGGKSKSIERQDIRKEEDTSFTQQAEATPEERALNVQSQQQLDAISQQRQQAQSGAFNLINALLTGQDLPGFLSGLPGGISPELTTEISQKAVEDITPSFQSSGILDSGVAAAVAGKTAGDVRRRSAEFNIQNLMNLLGIGFSGQSALESQGISQEANLGGRLAGLRKISGTGTGTSRTVGSVTTLAPNPFVTSLQSSFGTGLGNLGTQGVSSGAEQAAPFFFA